MLAAARAKSRGRMCCFCGGTDMGINDTVFWNFSGHCKIAVVAEDSGLVPIPDNTIGTGFASESARRH